MVELKKVAQSWDSLTLVADYYKKTSLGFENTIIEYMCEEIIQSNQMNSV